MVRRGHTHVIDTLAIRTILSQIPPNWLVRSLEERDYGIDLTLEIFDGENPTGKIALVQVKGSDSSFNSSVKLPFPTKTIEYALLFPEPFFVFHTSIPDKETYFVWLQKYVSTKLEKENDRWRSQEKVTIAFPTKNRISIENTEKSSESGKDRIERVMSLYAARSDGLEYLAAFEWFKGHWESFKQGQCDLIFSCLVHLKKMESCKRFLEVHEITDKGPNFLDARNCLESLLDAVRNKNNKDSVDGWVQSVDGELEKLEQLKRLFLDAGDMESFVTENSDTIPY
jgi:hypothetical protein